MQRVRPLMKGATAVFVTATSFGGLPPDPSRGRSFSHLVTGRAYETCEMSCELVEPAQFDVSGWTSWSKVNQRRFFSRSHSKSWIDVYLPTDRADTYVNGWAIPVGTEIVVAQYESAQARRPESLSVMVKLRGDWFWGIYEPSGRVAREQGRIQRCIECHSNAGSDWLFRHVSAATR